MNGKVFVYLVISLILYFTNYLYPENFSYGIKGGIGFMKLGSMSEGLEVNNQPDRSYPLGFSAGVFIENKISDSFSVINELMFQNSNVKQTALSGYEGVVEQKITFQYLSVSALLKYQTSFLADTYFFIGPAFSYLILAKYNSYDRIYSEGGELHITKDLPALSTTIELGLGEKFKLNSSNILLEVKTQLGLTRFKYNKHIGIGSWNNYGVTFLLGYQIN